MELQSVHPVALKDFSGFTPPGNAIPVIKRHHYEVRSEFEISGEAPKDFIRVYEHGRCRKANRRKWPL